MADSVFIWAAFSGFFFRIVTVSQSSDIVLAIFCLFPSENWIENFLEIAKLCFVVAYASSRSSAGLIVKKNY